MNPEDVPDIEDYKLSQIEGIDQIPALQRLQQEQDEHEKRVKKLDPITRKFKRVHTDRISRHQFYSDSGELVADDTQQFETKGKAEETQ